MNLQELQENIEMEVYEMIEGDYYSYFCEGDDRCSGEMELEITIGDELLISSVEFCAWEHARGFDIEVSMETLNGESDELINKYIPVENINEILDSYE